MQTPDPTNAPVITGHVRYDKRKGVLYEAIPGAAYKLKDRAYIVNSRGMIIRVELPKHSQPIINADGTASILPDAVNKENY